jgi:glucokinase
MVAIGIDLGGTNLRWCVVDESGEIRHRARRPSPKPVPEVVAALREAVAECRERFPEVAGVGLAVAGTVTEDRVSSVNLDWQEVPLAHELGLDGLPVIVENDMNAGAYGEMRFGGGRGLRNLIFVTISTGIGAGIIVGGRIYRGANGLAGEVGHTVVDLNGLLCGCGRRGCWEMIASGRAHQRRIREAFESGTWANLTEEPTPGQVTDRARSGDRAARALVMRTARYLGIGVTNLVNLYDPEAVIFTGGFARNNWDLIRDYLLNEVREQAFSQRFELRLTTLGDDAGLLGAAGLIMADARRTTNDDV